MSDPQPQKVEAEEEEKKRACVMEMRHVCLKYGSHEVLKDVSIRAFRGQRVALVGPNGAGKTSALRCLLGLARPSSGETLLFGQKRLKQMYPRIGYVPQKLQLNSSFHVTVREFLSLRIPATKSWFWQKDDAVEGPIAAISCDLEVDHLLDRQLLKLSGGELQRVLIAFSLLSQPEALALDEPTAGVDVFGEKAFLQWLIRVQKQYQLTVFMVSHDLNWVQESADWVYVLNQRILAEGPPEEALSDSVFRWTPGRS